MLAWRTLSAVQARGFGFTEHASGQVSESHAESGCEGQKSAW
jgi:hypothetical protein